MNIQFGAAQVQILNASEALKAAKDKAKTAKGIQDLKAAIAKKQDVLTQLPNDVSFRFTLDPNDFEKDTVQIQVGDIEDQLTRGGYDGDFFRHATSDSELLTSAIDRAKLFIKAISP
jgi:hypothetical protein